MSTVQQSLIAKPVVQAKARLFAIFKIGTIRLIFTFSRIIWEIITFSIQFMSPLSIQPRGGRYWLI